MTRVLLAALALIATSVPAGFAQTAPVSAESLYSAADGWVQRGLVQYQIAGAALAIVRDGRIVHAAGFGLADVQRNYRVDADSTQFHIASVTKLFTAIAALQQVEAGKLALHRDIRPMLGAINAAGWHRDSVTLHELLTHTAGLDTRWIGMAASSPDRVRSLREYLPGAMPPIVDTPGTVIRYSNLGYAAAGRLVEIASGLSWPEYIEQRVLAPLGMHHSFARPQLPGNAHATPYRYRTDTLAEPNIYEHASPSGAVHSTATDLAQLLIALLDTSSSTMLSPASKLLVLTPQHQQALGVRGYGYGTFEFPNATVQAVSAGGEVPGFSTRLLLVPSMQLGMVLMVNRKDPLLAVSVFDSVLSRLPPTAPESRGCGVRRTGSGPTTNIAGKYRSNVYDRGSFLRIGALLGPTFSVQRDTGQNFLIVNPVDNQAALWHAVGDSAWSGPNGSCLALVSTRTGSVLTVSTKVAGPVMLEPVTVISNPAVVVITAVVASLVLAFVLLAELRRRWRSRGRETIRGDRMRGAMVMGLAALHLSFLIAFGVGLYKVAIVYDDRFAFGLPPWFTAVLMLPYAIALLTVALVLTLSLRARNSLHKTQRWPAVAASVALLAMIWRWHMYSTL